MDPRNPQGSHDRLTEAINSLPSSSEMLEVGWLETRGGELPKLERGGPVPAVGRWRVDEWPDGFVGTASAWSMIEVTDLWGEPRYIAGGSRD